DRTVYGRFLPTVPTPEQTKDRSPESVFVFQVLERLKETITPLSAVIVDDATRLVAPPVVKGAVWRTFHAPPVNRMVKVVLRSAPNAQKVAEAARVELLSALQGVVTKINAGTKRVTVEYPELLFQPVDLA